MKDDRGDKLGDFFADLADVFQATAVTSNKIGKVCKSYKKVQDSFEKHRMEMEKQYKDIQNSTN